MIQVVSYPSDLSTWNAAELPFYFELFGETCPKLDTTYAEVVSPGQTAAETVASSPIYEYWWTIGHPGVGPGHESLWHRIMGDHDKSLWDNLADTAANVFLYFPTGAGWRIKELVATVKYLSPSEKDVSLSAKVGADWQAIAKGLSDAGEVSQLLKPIPVAGPVASSVGNVLAALSKLQIGSVPSGKDGFLWFVEKVTAPGGAGYGAMQGVMWSIPKDMFRSLGGRITGSLAVSFIPSQKQENGNTDPPWSFAAAPLRASAVVFSKEQHVVPPENKFLELVLKPEDPTYATDPKPSA